MRLLALSALAVTFAVSGCSGDAASFDTGSAAGPDASLPAGVEGEDANNLPGPDAGPKADTGAGVDPAKACADFAQAFCNKLSACSAFGLQAIYGDLATCRARAVLGCASVYTAAGTSATPERTETCVRSIPGLTCAAVTAFDFGADCAPAPGALANAAVCGDDAQCQSDFCARASTSTCGTCAAATAVGAACVNGACSNALACINDVCAKATPGKVGTACTSQAQCDLANGIACDTVSSKKCIQVTLATGAQPCGLIATGVAICPASGTCSAIFGGACSPAAADGAACADPPTGPTCLSPARCDHSVCKLPDAAGCK